jgi:RNA polymerase-binding transcription factor DksA
MNEKFLEQAEELSRAEVDNAIARARFQESKPIDFDGACSCGNEIPDARVQLGYYRCLECQTALEHKGRHARR